MLFDLQIFSDTFRICLRFGTVNCSHLFEAGALAPCPPHLRSAASLRLGTLRPPSPRSPRSPRVRSAEGETLAATEQGTPCSGVADLTVGS